MHWRSARPASRLGTRLGFGGRCGLAPRTSRDAFVGFSGFREYKVGCAVSSLGMPV